MTNQPQEPGPRYRIVGIRPDGSRATVKGGMTLGEAKLTGQVIEESQLFASLYVEPESDDDIPQAN
jgi:hypothetical protein